MTRLTVLAAAFAAATLFALPIAGAHAADEAAQTSVEGVGCYAVGCFDAAGNKVKRDGSPLEPDVDPVTTASVASQARGAIAAAGAGKSAASKGQFASIIARHAAAQGIPVGLATAVIRIESNFRVNARGSAGEVGLMQIKPSTARMLGYSGSVKALFEPETNIRYGMKYLAMAKSLGDGSVCGTILKYNAGHAASRMNPISAAYCAKVKRHMGS